MTPYIFTGAWQRISLSIGNDRPVEPGTVIWFQIADQFVDIRCPNTDAVLTGPGALAGTTSHSGSRLTWHHELEYPASNRSAVGEDSGTIEWQDDVIVKSDQLTTDGRKIGYAEVWARLDGSLGGPTHSMTPCCGAGLGIRVGQHAAAMHQPDVNDPTRWAAVQLRRSRIGWSPVLRLGDLDTAIAVERSIARLLGQPSSKPIQSRELEWETHETQDSRPP